MRGRLRDQPGEGETGNADTGNLDLASVNTTGKERVNVDSTINSPAHDRTQAKIIDFWRDEGSFQYERKPHVGLDASVRVDIHGAIEISLSIVAIEADIEDGMWLES